MKFSIFTAEKKSLYIAWASFRNDKRHVLMDTCHCFVNSWKLTINLISLGQLLFRK